MKKAFTLVELMIIIVILGLLSAMAIPAFQAVRANRIAKEVYHGKRVSQEEYEYLRLHAEKISEEYRSKRKVEVEPQSIPDAVPERIFILINGKRYKLVAE